MNAKSEESICNDYGCIKAILIYTDKPIKDVLTVGDLGDVVTDKKDDEIECDGIRYIRIKDKQDGQT